MTAAIKTVKPKALRPGATLGIISPASTPKADLVTQGIAALETVGYHTKLFPHALDRGPMYYAGTLPDRLADLHAAFADDEIDGIICTRGGWGSAELLPHLDKSLIAANPKALLGYSDITSLHTWLQRECGLVTFQAPMVAADFSHNPGPDLASWNAAFGGSQAWSLGAESGLRTLRPGTAEGVLDGGCISIYAEGLGTPYGPLAHDGLLFFEDLGVTPYQWDRMLVHLQHAGLLAGVRGIIFGDMQQCGGADEQQAIQESLLYALRDFAGPIAIGLRTGHVDSGNVTLPLGIQVRLDCGDAGNPQLHFLEAAVQG
jgi:muramoyltetrapeptide carboxypeptidase